eukprot:scaffold14255_cov21-Tisochrysis_lutea.AAC.1
MGNGSTQKPVVSGKPIQAAQTTLSGSEMDIDVESGSSAGEDSLTGSEDGSEGAAEDCSSMSEDEEGKDVANAL